MNEKILLRQDLRIVCVLACVQHLRGCAEGLILGVLGVWLVAHWLPDFVGIGAGIYMEHYLVLSNPDGGCIPQ